ncbi:RNA-directed DNA polymerase, eukaryota, reverse transcriptase zinc-binding domain protein [Tanacetum coccineum]
MTVVKANPSKILVWIKLFNVPLETWSIKRINTISSRLGKPLMMDQITTDMCNKGTGRLRHARVLVEIEVANGFLDSIEINYVNDQHKNKRTKWARVEHALKLIYTWEAMERKDVKNNNEEDVEENIECVVQTVLTDETILCIVKTIPKKIKTFINCVYASNNGIERRDLRNTLELDKRVVRNHPWAIMRDFNVTLQPDEHFNEGSGLSCEMQEFNEVVNNLEVDDLCSFGFHFTWTKSLKNPENATLKNLDKIMVNDYFTQQ